MSVRLLSVGTGLFLLGAVALSPPVLAAGGNLGVHVGYAKAESAKNGHRLLGGHLEIRPNAWLGIVGSVDYRLVESFEIGSRGQDLDIRSVPVTVSGRLYLPRMGSFNLFASVGAGWYFLVYDYEASLEDLGFEDRDENAFGWHVGVGASVMVAPQFSLYGEGRAVFLDADRSLDFDTLNAIEEFNYDSVYFAGGVSLHF